VTEALLGIDVGTTLCKAAVVSLDGRELAHGRRPTPWRSVPTGAEADPADLVAAAQGAAEDALAAARTDRVIAVGVTSMAETGVLSDGRGRPVAPAIAWYDRRGDAEASALGAALPGSSFSARAGLPVSALCSAVKLRWLREHVPSAREGRRWLSVAEWVVRRLGGDEVAERSLAARTGLFDQQAGDWWPEMIDWAGWPASLVPEPVAAGTPAGRVDGSLSAARGALLTVAGHDHLCAAVGAGAIEDGDVLDSCGTAEALIAARGGRLDEDRVAAAVASGLAVGEHVLPGRQAVLAGFPAGLVLARFRDLLGVAPDATPDLDAAALAAGGAGGLSVEDMTAGRARIVGVGPGASPGALWCAAVEALAGHGAAVLGEIERFTGPSGRVVLTGGWGRSAALLAAKQRRLGALVCSPVSEAAARGAALAGGCAAGVYASIAAVPRPVASGAETSG